VILASFVRGAAEGATALTPPHPLRRVAEVGRLRERIAERNIVVDVQVAQVVNLVLAGSDRSRILGHRPPVTLVTQLRLEGSDLLV
jgi:hypothetical protein